MPPISHVSSNRPPTASFSQRFAATPARTLPPRESLLAGIAQNALVEGAKSVANFIAASKLQPLIDEATTRSSVIRDGLSAFEQNAADMFSRFGEESNEFRSAVGNLQLERADLLRHEGDLFASSAELTTRQLSIERSAVGLEMGLATLKLLDREGEIRDMANTGNTQGAWAHTLGTATEVMVDGLMALPNRFGGFLGVAADVSASELAYQAGSQLGALTYDSVDRGVWWFYDHGLTGGRTPQTDRPDLSPATTDVVIR